MYFLIEAETRLPPGMTDTERADLDAREAEVGSQLARARKIVHIWRVPGRQANISVWSCDDGDDLHQALTSLPAWPWMSITVRALAEHPLGGIAEAAGPST